MISGLMLGCPRAGPHLECSPATLIYKSQINILPGCLLCWRGLSLVWDTWENVRLKLWFIGAKLARNSLLPWLSHSPGLPGVTDGFAMVVSVFCLLYMATPVLPTGGRVGRGIQAAPEWRHLTDPDTDHLMPSIHLPSPAHCSVLAWAGYRYLISGPGTLYTSSVIARATSHWSAPVMLFLPISAPLAPPMSRELLLVIATSPNIWRQTQKLL